MGSIMKITAVLHSLHWLPNKPTDHLQVTPTGVQGHKLSWSNLPPGAPHPSNLTPVTQVWQLKSPRRATDEAGNPREIVPFHHWGHVCGISSQERLGPQTHSLF